MKNNYIIVMCSFMVLSLPVSATALYKCKDEAGRIEYTDKPCRSGSQEQNIQQKSKGRSSSNTKELNAYQVNATKYLDNLKKCNSSAFSSEVPFIGKVKNKIVGKNNGRCHVITYTDLGGEVVCNYSDETIALLTSEKKYQEIKNGEFFGSSDSPEAARMSAECIFPNQ